MYEEERSPQLYQAPGMRHCSVAFFIACFLDNSSGQAQMGHMHALLQTCDLECYVDKLVQAQGRRISCCGP